MRCRPGDLAIVIRSLYGECVGKICEVVCQHDEKGWRVKFPRPIVTHLSSGRELISTNAYAFDDWLRPIRPGDLDDETPTDIQRELTKETT